MAKKNANEEGSRPRRRPDGRWEARYWSDGKRRSLYGKTRKESRTNWSTPFPTAEKAARGMGPGLPAWVITCARSGRARPAPPD